MSALAFPSVTMKDVDWGHIERRCSRNITRPLYSGVLTSLCIRSAPAFSRTFRRSGEAREGVLCFLI